MPGPQDRFGARPQHQQQARQQQGSQTQVQVQEPSQQQSAQTPPPAAILRLRGAHAHVAGHHVQWAENVVDNEGLGRKSSKGRPSSLVPLRRIICVQ